MWRTYIRDEILLDATFLQKIQTDIATNNIPPGSTLVLAARQFTFGAGFTLTLPGFNLLILADTFDSASGGIDVSGLNGSNGRGAENGSSGSSATNVTLFCRTLANVRILSN